MQQPDRLLWVTAEPGDSDAYVEAEIIGSLADGSLRVATLHGERTVKLGLDAFPRSIAPLHEPSDLCACEQLHTPALLHCLQRRFEAERAYATWIGTHAMLWLHPCGPTPELFTAQAMMQAAAATDGVDTAADPGVYTLAERALRAARGTGATTSAAIAAGAVGGPPPPPGSSGACILLHGETGGGQSSSSCSARRTGCGARRIRLAPPRASRLPRAAAAPAARARPIDALATARRVPPCRAGSARAAAAAWARRRACSRTARSA